MSRELFDKLTKKSQDTLGATEYWKVFYKDFVLIVCFK